MSPAVYLEEHLRQGEGPVQSPEAGVHWCVLAGREGVDKRIQEKGVREEQRQLEKGSDPVVPYKSG